MTRDLAGVSESIGRDIPYRLLFTRVRPLTSRVATEVFRQASAAGLARFDGVLIEREAYKEMFLTGEPPTDSEPTKAGVEVTALLAEIRKAVAHGKAGTLTRKAGAA